MKADIPFISRMPPLIGSSVKIWFDKKSGDLIVEDGAGQMTRDIYGVCLADAVFETEPTVRGATRCIVSGKFLAVPGTTESSTIQREIHALPHHRPEFYWWRDKTWPIKQARLAFIAKPSGGFATTVVVDPIA